MKRFDFGLPELIAMLVVTAAMGAVLVLPKFAVKVSAVKCVNNLKNVGLAYRIFSSDNNDKFPWQIPLGEGGTLGLTNQNDAWRHFLVLSNELSTPQILACQTDKTRIPAPSFNLLANPNISYFCAISGSSVTSTNAWLAGDRRILIAGKPHSIAIVNLETNQPIRWVKRIHPDRGAGNIAFADGHVETPPDAQLRAALTKTGPTSTTLIFP